ncbi:hypothetical protein KQX54_015161 [Cotesia glomerata]|uniref:Uncharacterized protein n=1 Tax=Cotesia glomerata TaxID=32391 RepID=A0AAV7I074_COTGL|nr:hypothetical protein KQX54_015161 [Cotesia glomerata]
MFHWVHRPQEHPLITEESRRFKLNLPSSIFASSVKEKVRLLNKAAPVLGSRLDFDPNVETAMDDDFNYDDPDN